MMNKLINGVLGLVIAGIIGTSLYVAMAPFLWLRDVAANTRRIVELLEAERSSDVRTEEVR